jgi:hypothetical protein
MRALKRKIRKLVGETTTARIKNVSGHGRYLINRIRSSRTRNEIGSGPGRLIFSIQNMPSVFEYTGEFGTELILFRPFMAWLSSAGLLKGRKIKTYVGMRHFYSSLECEEIIEKTEKRLFVDYDYRPDFLPIKCEHDFDKKPTAPFLLFEDFRKVFGQTSLPEAVLAALGDKPLLIIHNKINVEWDAGPKNVIDGETLEKIFSDYNQKYKIIYIRHGMRPNSDLFEDHHPFVAAEFDKYLTEKYKILLFEDLYDLNSSTGGMRDVNLFKCALYSKCFFFISSQGGGALQISCFSGSLMMVLHSRGNEENWAYDQGYYSFASNPCPIRTIFRTCAELRGALALLDKPVVESGRVILNESCAELLRAFSPSSIKTR